MNAQSPSIDYLQTEIAVGESQRIRLVVRGEIDMGSAGLVRDAITNVLDARPSELTIDMSAVGFCDLLGLVALTSAADACRRDGIKLGIIGVSLPVRRAFEISGLTSLLEPSGTDGRA